jgi:hypothetical protein
MRILLVRDALTSASPPKVTVFLTQLAIQAAAAGHELRELVSNRTDDDIGLAENRAAMRMSLDREVAVFDPQVIHIQGIGVLGHLALETGVPYVISAFSEELAVGQVGSKLHNFSQQAVENAGCVLVESDHTRRRLLAEFGEVETIVVANEITNAPVETGLAWLWQLYRQIADARHRL